MQGGRPLRIGCVDIRSFLNKFLDLGELSIHSGCQQSLIHWSHGQEQREQGTEGAKYYPLRDHVGLQIDASRGKGL
jgi:hypothetical protein